MINKESLNVARYFTDESYMKFKVIKTCGACKREHDEAFKVKVLEGLGYFDCRCGSTLCVKVSDLEGQTLSENN